VSPTTQPLPLSAASNTPPPNGDLDRLMTLWRDLALRAAQAAAHDGDQEVTLTGLQLQVEQAITDRHPEMWGVIDQLLVWESTLAHHASGPSETCLDCRRPRRGLSLTPSLPAAKGGTR